MRRVTPCPWALVVAAIVLALTTSGCGRDDESGASSDDRRQEDTTVPSSSDASTPADVRLTAAVRLDGRRVLFDYALANGGAAPVAVVDPDTVIDTLEPVGAGGYRASYLRTEGDTAGGSPLPSLVGMIVGPGDELTGTAGISGEFDTLPETVELCIEVVPQPWTDDGAGVARFPYRPIGADPALACTDQLTVPAPG